VPNAEKITKRILEEAEQSAAAIVEEARKTAAEDLAAAQKKAEDILQQAAREATEAAAEHKKHKLAAIESELRKEVLATRRRLLESVFEKALTKLAAMAPEEQIKMMVSRILEAAPDGRGEILLTKKDAADLGPQLLAAVEKLYTSKGVKPELTISKQTINATGGFVLKAGNIEYNNTFETLIKASKGDLEGQIVSVLFAGETHGQS